MTTRANGPLSGLAWLRRGLRAGRHHPRAVFGGAAVLMVAALVPGVVQALLHGLLRPGPGAASVIAALTTLFAVALLAPLMGGYLRLIDASEHGRAARAADVFAPFRSAQDAQQLIGFTLVVLLLQLGALSLLYALFGQAMTALVDWYAQVMALMQQARPGQPLQAPAPPDGLGGMFGLGGLFALFVAGTFAVGLGQVALRGQRLGAALRDGLAGAARNLLPLLVLGALSFALLMAVSLAMLLVLAVLGLLPPVLAAAVFVPLYLAFTLVAYAVMFGVAYHLWRDVAGAAPAPGLEA